MGLQPVECAGQYCLYNKKLAFTTAIEKSVSDMRSRDLSDL